MPPRRHPARRRTYLALENLESRELLAYAPTALEQLFLERLNDARANPAAYGQMIGLDLSGVAPSQPLAINPNLVQSARDHSQDMNDRRFFAHTNPSGAGPGQRIQAVGFPWAGYGESLAAGIFDPTENLAALIIDAGIANLGHRRHLLAIDGQYRPHTQVGVGIVQNGSGPYRHYYTIDTGYLGDNRPFLTGVVMNDVNGNGVYDVGEGLGGVTITIAGVGAVSTFDSGGYSIQLNPGTYTVTASGGALSGPVTRTVVVGPTNVRVNFTPATLPSAVFEDAVQRLYQSALGRTASPAEVAPWAQLMQGPGGPAFVATAIERSHEARTRLVKSWYATYLYRAAAANEEQVWVNALMFGITEEQILSGILSSAEYYNLAAASLGVGPSDEAYVQVLFQTFLGRIPGAGEIANFIHHFVTPLGRATAARVLLGSIEYRSAQVYIYYANILGRSPGDAEIYAWVVSGIDLCSIRIRFESSQEFVYRR
jgi:uncharacterized protein YkwD